MAFLVSQLVFLNSPGECTYGGLPTVAQKHCPAMPSAAEGNQGFLSLFIKNDPSSQIYSFGFCS